MKNNISSLENDTEEKYQKFTKQLKRQQKELKNQQKEYITILAIFAAILLEGVVKNKEKE